MAAHDIMPLRDTMGGNGVVEEYELNGAPGFVVGEPVGFDDSAGQLVECAPAGDNPTAAELLGIALGPGAVGSTAHNNWKTGAAYAAGDQVPVSVPSDSQLYITPNFTTNGSAFNNAAPGIANIGDEAGLVKISNDWGLEISGSLTSNGAVCRVVDILDDKKRSIRRTNATLTTSDTYYVVFKIGGHLNRAVGDLPSPLPA